MCGKDAVTHWLFLLLLGCEVAVGLPLHRGCPSLSLLASDPWASLGLGSPLPQRSPDLLLCGLGNAAPRIPEILPAGSGRLLEPLLLCQGRNGDHPRHCLPGTQGGRGGEL